MRTAAHFAVLGILVGQVVAWMIPPFGPSSITLPMLVVALILMIISVLGEER